MEPMTQILLAILGALFTGGGLGTIGTLWIKSRQQISDHYNDHIARLEKRIDKLEGDHKKCMEDHRTTTAQYSEIKGRFDELHLFLSTQYRSGPTIAVVDAAGAKIEQVPQQAIGNALAQSAEFEKLPQI